VGNRSREGGLDDSKAGREGGLDDSKGGPLHAAALQHVAPSGLGVGLGSDSNAVHSATPSAPYVPVPEGGGDFGQGREFPVLDILDGNASYGVWTNGPGGRDGMAPPRLHAASTVAGAAAAAKAAMPVAPADRMIMTTLQSDKEKELEQKRRAQATFKMHRRLYSEVERSRVRVSAQDRVFGARWSTGIYTRGCHWFSRMFASIFACVHSSYWLAPQTPSKC
jgi:hypothetical protein